MRAMYKRKSAALVPKQRITTSSSTPEVDDSSSVNDEMDSKAYGSFRIELSEEQQKPQIKMQQQSAQSQSQPSQQRCVGSLVLLTQKFVELMKQNGGSIDLKEVHNVFPYIYMYMRYLSFSKYLFQATKILDVQKRRIYDITNVLEGIGLIDKGRHCSLVRWR